MIWIKKRPYILDSEGTFEVPKLAVGEEVSTVMVTTD